MARVIALFTIATATGYHVPDTPSAEFDLEPELLEDFLSRGWVELVGDQDAPVQSDLPEGFPHREELLSAGVATVAAVAGMEDLTSVKGIGKKGAKLVQAAIDALPTPDSDDGEEGGEDGEGGEGEDEAEFEEGSDSDDGEEIPGLVR